MSLPPVQLVPNTASRKSLLELPSDDESVARMFVYTEKCCCRGYYCCKQYESTVINNANTLAVRRKYYDLAWWCCCCKRHDVFVDVIRKDKVSAIKYRNVKKKTPLQICCGYDSEVMSLWFQCCPVACVLCLNDICCPPRTISVIFDHSDGDPSFFHIFESDEPRLLEFIEGLGYGMPQPAGAPPMQQVFS